MTEFKYEPMFQLGEDKTEYYKVPGSEQYVSTSEFEGHKILKVSPEALTLMSNTRLPRRELHAAPLPQ